MNGRIYDPITKQMTSPDIIDVNPYSTQSYNRYAYVVNNPMKYVDPSGYVSVGAYNGGGWNPNIDCSYYGQMARITEYAYLSSEFDEMEAVMSLMWGIGIAPGGGISELGPGSNIVESSSIAHGSSWLADFVNIFVAVKHSDGKITNVSSSYKGISFSTYEQVDYSAGKVKNNRLYFTIIGEESGTVGLPKIKEEINSTNIIIIWGYVDLSTNTLYLNLYPTGYWFHRNRYYPAN